VSLYIVDIHGELEGDYEIIRKYEEPTTKNDLALIHTEGLDEEIRCTMCTNSMKSDRGCDGNCVVNKDMYKAVMDAIEKRIQSTTKNDLGVDCISRQKVLDLMIQKWGENSSGDSAMQESINIIRILPSVTPQEPFINKPCVSSGVCEHDKNKVLDKIRAEIEQRPYGIANDSVIQGMKYERVAILEILDKYKAESEDT
jgi:hypothetical protein